MRSWTARMNHALPWALSGLRIHLLGRSAMTSRWKSSSCLVLFVGFAALSAWSAGAGNAPGSAPLPAQLIRYDVPGGETLFALELKGSSGAAAAPHDHVILVD